MEVVERGLLTAMVEEPGMTTTPKRWRADCRQRHAASRPMDGYAVRIDGMPRWSRINL